MNKISGILRLGIVLSVLWLIGQSLYLRLWERYGFKHNLDDFIAQGVLPLVIFWGLVWIISGFRNKDDKPEDNDEDEGESDD